MNKPEAKVENGPDSMNCLKIIIILDHFHLTDLPKVSNTYLSFAFSLIYSFPSVCSHLFISNPTFFPPFLLHQKGFSFYEFTWLVMDLQLESLRLSFFLSFNQLFFVMLKLILLNNIFLTILLCFYSFYF